jgi:hypothetical protein
MSKERSKKSKNDGRNWKELFELELSKSVNEATTGRNCAICCALQYKMPESFVLRLLMMRWYGIRCIYKSRYHPLYLACKYEASERVILAIVAWYCTGATGLKVFLQARRMCKFPKVNGVLEELINNPIDVGNIVGMYEVGSIRRHDTLEWLQCNSPVCVDGKYMQL